MNNLDCVHTFGPIKLAESQNQNTKSKTKKSNTFKKKKEGQESSQSRFSLPEKHEKLEKFDKKTASINSGADTASVLAPHMGSPSVIMRSSDKSPQERSFDRPLETKRSK